MQSLLRLAEVLKIDISKPDDANYGTNLRAVVRAVQTALGTQVRVDENRLRRRQLDNMPQLLARISAAEAALGSRAV